MLSKLSSLSISSLLKFDEEADKFYDRKDNLYELPFLDAILNMRFVRTLILKLTKLDILSKFHLLIKLSNSLIYLAYLETIQ